MNIKRKASQTRLLGYRPPPKQNPGEHTDQYILAIVCLNVDMTRYTRKSADLIVDVYWLC